MSWTESLCFHKEESNFILMGLMKDTNSQTFWTWSPVTLPIFDLTIQQNLAKSLFYKSCLQICPKGVNVCMSVFMWLFSPWILQMCVCVSVCFRCLNSPLFSLLIPAAAACEAWANDDEGKKSDWLTAQFTLSPSPTVFDQQEDAKQRKLATLCIWAFVKMLIYCGLQYSSYELLL